MNRQRGQSQLFKTFAKSETAQWALGLSIALLAAGMRLFDIGSQPLWLDEGYSWWDAQQTLARLWSLVPQCDPHPPLYFLALKAWMNEFGDSSQALRALSALLGVATTAIVILAGRELDIRIGWLAGLLFALTPFQIDYGREARPYALLCFGASLILFGALRIARATREDIATAENEAQMETARRWGWFSLVLGGIIVLWTNNTAIFIVAATLVAFSIWLLADERSRPLLKPLLACAIVIIAAWLPYVPVIVEQAHGVIDDFWIPPPNGWNFIEELSGLIGLNIHNAVIWAAFALLGGLILMWRRRSRRESILLLCLIALPILFNYLFSITVRPIFLSRAMIGITPAVVLVMATSVVWIQRKSLRYSALAALLIAHVFALYAWRLADQGNEPWDRIARELAPATKTARPTNDAIVLLTANELALPLEHAFEDLHVTLPVQGVPANFPSPGLHARYPSGKCAPSLLNQDLSAVAHLIARYPVVYFVTRTNNVYDPGNRIVKLLSSIGYTQMQEESFAPGSLEVYKFVGRQQAKAQR